MSNHLPVRCPRCQAAGEDGTIIVNASLWVGERPSADYPGSPPSMETEVVEACTNCGVEDFTAEEEGEIQRIVSDDHDMFCDHFADRHHGGREDDDD